MELNRRLLMIKWALFILDSESRERGGLVLFVLSRLSRLKKVLKGKRKDRV